MTEEPKKKVTKRSLKAVLDLDPVHPAAKLNETVKNQSNIDLLIKLGLGDPKQIIYYRKVFQDPKAAVMNTQLRKYAGEVLEDLLDIVFADQTTFQRIRMFLQNNTSGSLPTTKVNGLSEEKRDKLPSVVAKVFQ